MNIKEWPSSNSELFIAQANLRGLSYDGDAYSALISPCSAILSEDEFSNLLTLPKLLWDWSKKVNEIYGSLLRERGTPHQLVSLFEWGLSKQSILVQRESVLEEEIPRLGRVDLVHTGGHHSVAEMQWKGGGEGFIAEVEDICKTIFPSDPSWTSFPRLIPSWSNYFRNLSKDGGCIINTGRENWKHGDHLLAAHLLKEKVGFYSFSAGELASLLTIDRDRLCLKCNNIKQPVTYIYLDRITEALPEPLLSRVIELSRKGKLILDPPPSYLYNQKINLALPFLEAFSSDFSPLLKNFLIPSVLVLNAKPNLESIATTLDHPKAYLLLEIKKWEELLMLPKSLRELLVFKCASSNSRYNHGAKGVWRLWGSMKVATSLLHQILESAIRYGEPWILQPYISQTWTVPFAHPRSPRNIQHAKAHGRFGFYCAYNDDSAYLQGAIATFSPFWKVAGKSATIDKSGRLSGSGFCDIRLR